MLITNKSVEIPNLKRFINVIWLLTKFFKSCLKIDIVFEKLSLYLVEHHMFVFALVLVL